MNINSAFTKFDDNITLSQSKRNSIITSRNAIRDKIKKIFKENKKRVPSFYIQGSFATHTALAPLSDEEVDIDDGLYLNNIESDDMEKWPSPKEVHKEIVDALDGHTQDGCEDKTSCVRVIYRNDYHVDIPVYIMKDNHAYLANTKSNEWVQSDSKDFKDWYAGKIKADSGQARRITRYVKAWRDYKKVKMASIEIAILVAEHFVKDDSDLLSLKNTLNAIYWDVLGSKMIKKPVSPYENLWENKSQGEKSGIIGELKDFLNDVEDACNATDSEASTFLQGCFGNRFPQIEEKRESVTSTYSEGPKPWARI